ncbi:replicative DNA helicase [Azospirillum sp.]|uniref:replicative DNA helicase n=1 Tax=Azospirillum sp. TaxID=34012 RepID=UPI002D5AE457|nr:replicative DNA helicase [Azospirillum sp.]HYD68498.1 replicative DNA helicase [Azospirillum sp.]
MKAPPHNEEAEQALLGALLVNNRAFEKVAEFLRPEHFYDPVHQRLYGAIADAVSDGRSADPISLKRYFDADLDLVVDGGAKYLAELAANVVTVVNAREYGREIVELYMRRQMIEAGHQLIDFGYLPDDQPAERRLEEIQGALFTLAERQDGNAIVNAGTAVAETLSRIEAAWKAGGAVAGVTTGLHDLDRMTGGMKPGQLWICAGRPAMGKSAMAITTTARKAAQSGVPVAIFSAEMTRDGLVARWLAAETGISTQQQDRGELDPASWLQLQRAGERLAKLPVFIDDSDTLTPMRLRQRMLRLRRQKKVGLVIVDHLQRMNGDRAYRSDYEERSATVKAVKSAAKAAGVPVMLLCQLSRKVEEREDKRPQLSDLRESGRIEEEADVVLALHRDEYYASKEEPVQRGEDDGKFNDRHARWQQRMSAARGVADFLVLKQRDGRTGAVQAHYDAERTLFSDLARE